MASPPIIYQTDPRLFLETYERPTAVFEDCTQAGAEGISRDWLAPLRK
jgi:hypothetical protein